MQSCDCKPLHVPYKAIQLDDYSEYTQHILWMSLTIHIFLSAIELVKELMDYEVGEQLLSGLVSLLRPAKEDIIAKPDLLDGI